MCVTPLTIAAQESATAPAAAAASHVVPNLINYTGVLKDTTGRTLTSLTGVTFLLYSSEQGGAPLWLETQNVTPDKTGRYTVQLGAVSENGIPADLFMNGEARWLALQIGNEPEQSRVLLVAVPYAMKSVDAQTLGGLPPSAFVLAAPPTSGAPVASATTAPPSASSASVVPLVTSDVTTSGGAGGTIPMFTTATNIQNAIMTQTGTTAINVLGTLNLPATGAATAVKGFNSQAQRYVASVFNSTTSTAVPQNFLWQAEPANNDKSTATGTLNLLFAQGAAVPAETGLKINNKGQLTFAAGQTFPGTGPGTVKSVGLTAPATDFTVSGSPVTGTGTLNFAWNVVPTPSDFANAIVKRDGSGSFAAGNGSFSGNLASAGTVSGASLAASNAAITNTLSVGTNLTVGGTINGGRGVLITQLLGNFEGGPPAPGYFNMITDYVPPVNATAFTYNRCSGAAGGAGQELSFRSAIRTPTGLGGAVSVGNAFFLFPTSASTETIFDENNDFFTLNAGQSYDFGIEFGVLTSGQLVCSTVVQIFSK